MVNSKLVVEPNFVLGAGYYRETTAVWLHEEGGSYPRFSEAYSLEEAKRIAADILATVKRIEDDKPKEPTGQEIFDKYVSGAIIKFEGYVPFVKRYGGEIVNALAADSRQEEIQHILNKIPESYTVLSGTLL